MKICRYIFIFLAIPLAYPVIPNNDYLPIYLRRIWRTMFARRPLEWGFLIFLNSHHSYYIDHNKYNI